MRTKTRRDAAAFVLLIFIALFVTCRVRGQGVVDYVMNTSGVQTNQNGITNVTFTANTIPTEPPPASALDPLKLILSILEGHAPWLVTLMTWMATMRVAFKPFNAWLQKRITNYFMSSVSKPGGDHDAFIQNILVSKKYRTVAFWLDILASIKLPSIDTYMQRLVRAFPSRPATDLGALAPGLVIARAASAMKDLAGKGGGKAFDVDEIATATELELAKMASGASVSEALAAVGKVAPEQPLKTVEQIASEIKAKLEKMEPQTAAEISAALQRDGNVYLKPATLPTPLQQTSATFVSAEDKLAAKTSTAAALEHALDVAAGKP